MFTQTLHHQSTRINLLRLNIFQIWDLSDPTGKGYLDKAGLFVALKLVALAQSGETINMANIFLDPPNPPKVVST